jgi:hypothetical protein
VRGHAARKHLEKLGDLKSEPGLAAASILIADDGPGMRNFLVRKLEWTFSRVLARREFVTSAACPKRSRIGRITMLQGVGGTKLMAIEKQKRTPFQSCSFTIRDSVASVRRYGRKSAASGAR